MRPPIAESLLPRWSRRILLGFVGVSSAWALSGLVAAYAFVHRFRDPSPEPAPAGLEQARLRTADGLSLGAWIGRVPNPRGTVVLLHGNGANRTSLWDDAMAFRDLGFDVLAVTLRAHGDSEGTRNDFGWGARHDVIAAVSRAESIAPGRPVVVYGISLGAAAAIFAGPGLGERVSAYILVAPYARLREAVEHRTTRYLPPVVRSFAYSALLVGARVVLPEFDRIAPVDASRRMPWAAPTLFFAGSRDDRAPPRDSRRIMAPLRNARLIVVSGAGHEDMGLGCADRRMREPSGEFLDVVSPP